MMVLTALLDVSTQHYFLRDIILGFSLDTSSVNRSKSLPS